MVAIRWASIVLPAPGGPIIMTLCAPAAAMMSARFTLSCPFTSAKSTSYADSTVSIFSIAASVVSRVRFSERNPTACAREPTP